MFFAGVPVGAKSFWKGFAFAMLVLTAFILVL